MCGNKGWEGGGWLGGLGVVGWLREGEGDWGKKGMGDREWGWRVGWERTGCGGLGVKGDGEWEVGREGGGGLGDGREGKGY